MKLKGELVAVVLVLALPLIFLYGVMYVTNKTAEQAEKAAIAR